MNVHLHIDRLVLDGLDLAPGDAGQVSSAVEAELVRLLADAGLAPHWLGGGAVPEVAAPQMTPADRSPRATGQAIAQSVYAGLGR